MLPVMAYNPSLDVLRVIAVVLVLAFHARLPGMMGGWIGVDLFFVLSGFLITRLLLAERDRTGSIDIPEFWLRRLRRLTPALVLMLATYLAVATFIWPRHQNGVLDATVAALYLSDYWAAYGQWPAHLSHTWSLAVEERYYLLWPLVLLALVRAGNGLRACLLLMIASATIVRWLAVEQGVLWEVTYYAFHNRLTGLLLGSAAALLYRPVPHPRSTFAAGMMAFGFAVLVSTWGEPADLMFPMMLAEIGALAMVLACAARPELLTSSRLAPLGKYTYGIYLWHYPIMLIFRDEQSIWATFGLGSVIALVCAFASYHTVEAVVGPGRRAPLAAPARVRPTISGP